MSLGFVVVLAEFRVYIMGVFFLLFFSFYYSFCSFLPVPRRILSRWSTGSLAEDYTYDYSLSEYKPYIHMFTTNPRF